MTTVLHTIAPSHFCEKARWALRRAHLPFEEASYAPILHIRPVRAATSRAGISPTSTTPTLVLPDGSALTDSTAILRWVDAHPDATWRPYAAGAGVEAVEELADEQVGPHARRLAYHHLLAEPALGRALIRRWALPWISPAAPLFFPVMAAGLRRGLGISPAGAERSRQRVLTALDTLDARLGDGRRWFVGDTFSAADLTVAALLGPLLLPDAMTDRWPALTEAPRALVELAEALRERPTGRLAMRAFASERP